MCVCVCVSDELGMILLENVKEDSNKSSEVLSAW